MAAGTQEDNTAISAVYRMPCTVQWGDCDPAGIIWYPTYDRWMDAASWAMFSQVGFTAQRMRAENVSLPLVHSECRFERSPTYGDTCTVLSGIAHWGSKSFSVRHLFMAADGGTLARGQETRVWCRHENGPGSPLRGVVIPDSLKALFAPPR